jgi:hypothetical protein
VGVGTLLGLGLALWPDRGAGQAPPSGVGSTLLQGLLQGVPVGEPISAITLPEAKGILLSLPELLDRLRIVPDWGEKGEVALRVWPEGPLVHLDPAGEVRLDGNAAPFSPLEVATHEGHLYLSPKGVEHLFPLAVEVDLRGQRFHLEPTARLSLPPALERALARARWLRTPPSGGEVPPEPFPYQLWSFPSADLWLGAQWEPGAPGGEPSGLAYDYDLQLTGELGYATHRLFLRGDRGDPLMDLRIRGDRIRAEGGLGKWGALSSLSWGHLPTPRLALLGAGADRLGIAMSGFPLHEVGPFDELTVEGDAPPGWEAELYLGENLLAVGVVSPLGRYAFEAVPLEWGDQAFRVRLFGPAGEIREEVQRIRVAPGLTPPGPPRMRLQVGEGGEFHGETRWGIHRGLTLQSFLARIPDGIGGGMERRWTGGIGAQGGFGPWGLLLEGGVQEGGGQAGRVQLQRPWGRFQLQGSRTQFQHWNTPAARIGGRRAIAESTLRAQTQIPMGRRPLFLRGELRHTTLAEGIQRAQIHWNGRFSGGGWGVGYGTTWILERTPNREDGLVLRAHHAPLLHLGTPRTRLTVSSHSGELRFQADLRPNRAFHLSLSGGEGSVSIQGSRTFSGLQSQLALSRSPQGPPQLRSGVRLALVREPGGRVLLDTGLGGGEVRVRIVEDRNGNGQLDPGVDLPVSGVALRMAEWGGEPLPKSGLDGLIRLPGLPVDRPVRLEVDRSSLPDPFWVPDRSVLSIIPRQGRAYETTILLVEGGELSGHLSRFSRGVGAEPLSGVVLEVASRGRPGDPIQTVRTLQDGHFLLTPLAPGPYWIRIRPGQSLGGGPLPEGGWEVHVGPWGQPSSPSPLILHLPPAS